MYSTHSLGVAATQQGGIDCRLQHHRVKRWGKLHDKLPFVPLLVVSVFTCVFVARGFSVETAGIIEGTVEDSSGAVVAGVQVTVTNEQTGEAKSFTTGRSDDSSFPTCRSVRTT